MRHKKHKFKLSCDPAQRKSIVRGLCADLITHEKVKTTITKSRAIKPMVEKLVTLAKKDTVANRRLAFAKLNNANAVKKLFGDIGPKYTERPGGYTRITKLADTRVGDGSKMSYISFV